MDPRIPERRLPEPRPLHGLRPVTERRDPRQPGGRGRAFEEALAEQGEERGGAGPGDEAPAARTLQDRPRIVRRQGDDGIPHVDVLA